ncbi:MAG: phosphotransferase [Leptospirales bacterium]
MHIGEKEIIKKIVEAYFGSEKQNTHIQAEYEYVRLTGGLTNYNYLLKINNKGSFFLKIFRKAPAKRVKALVYISMLLQKRNFPTPHIIKPIQGDYWQEDQYSAIITEYITGVHPIQSEDTLHKIGNVMSVLHLLKPDKDVAETLIQSYSLNFQNRMEQMRGSKIPEELSHFIDLARPHIDVIEFESFYRSIIHGDIFLDNVMVSEMNDFFFIDFEGGCIDNAIFDIARAIIGCCLKYGEIDPELCKAFLFGYTLIRPLEPNEAEMIYEYIIYAGTVSALWRFTEFDLARVEENRMGIYRELMKPTLALIKMGKKKACEDLINPAIK